MTEGRWIDRDMIRRAKMVVSKEPEDAMVYGWNRACDLLADSLPGVDIPVERVASWEISSDGYYPYCSHCHYTPPWGEELTRYCPDCGSRMTGSGQDRTKTDETGQKRT